MMQRKQRIFACVIACTIMSAIICAAPITVSAENVKDVYIDNTVDNSQSIVTGEVITTDAETGESTTEEVYNESYSVTYSNPKTAQVQGAINDAYTAAYQAGKAISDDVVMSTEESTGKVWDNRKYTTVEDGDAVLIGDSDYLTGAYGVNEGYTRTHIASGDYGKITYYSVKASVEKKAEDPAPEEPAGQEDPAPEEPTGQEDPEPEEPSGQEDPAPEEPTEQEHPAQEDSGEDGHTGHSYVWQITRQATPTEDGEMIYTCSECGAVRQRVPVSGYVAFNMETAAKIAAAAQGAEIRIKTQLWQSIYTPVLQELVKRPDVTLRIVYTEKGTDYEVTVPAGTDAASLADENGYAGFLFLSGLFGATEQ